MMNAHFDQKTMADCGVVADPLYNNSLLTDASVVKLSKGSQGIRLSLF
jgi:hypothetical protein